MHKRKHEPTVEPMLLTVTQVAAMLNLGRSKVYNLIRFEGLPTVKLGAATRVPVKELEAWLKTRIA
jgi:excisionase family DNA binding protein